MGSAILRMLNDPFDLIFHVLPAGSSRRPPGGAWSSTDSANPPNRHIPHYSNPALIVRAEDFNDEEEEDTVLHSVTGSDASHLGWNGFTGFKPTLSQAVQAKTALSQASQIRPSIPQPAQAPPTLSQAARALPSLSQPAWAPPTLSQPVRARFPLSMPGPPRPPLSQQPQAQRTLPQDEEAWPTLSQAAQAKQHKDPGGRMTHQEAVQSQVSSCGLTAVNLR